MTGRTSLTQEIFSIVVLFAGLIVSSIRASTRVPTAPYRDSVVVLIAAVVVAVMTYVCCADV